VCMHMGQVIIPESVRQGSAACLFEDLALLWNAWDFDIMDLHPDVAKSVHIWHGTKDMQVCTFAWKHQCNTRGETHRQTERER
jgi:hypothetical protein